MNHLLPCCIFWGGMSWRNIDQIDLAVFKNFLLLLLPSAKKNHRCHFSIYTSEARAREISAKTSFHHFFCSKHSSRWCNCIKETRLYQSKFLKKKENYFFPLENLKKEEEVLSLSFLKKFYFALTIIKLKCLWWPLRRVWWNRQKKKTIWRRKIKTSKRKDWNLLWWAPFCFLNEIENLLLCDV
jgi:hypothetical protein